MKKCSKALSILLAILLVATIMFVGVTAEEPVTVNGEELVITNWGGTKNSTVGDPTTGEAFYAENDKTPLLPAFLSTRLTLGWNTEGNIYKVSNLASFYQNHSNQKEKILRYTQLNEVSPVTTFDKCPNIVDVYSADKSKGFMFYIKLDKESAETRLALEALTIGFDADGKIIMKDDETSYTQVYNRINANTTVYYMPVGTNTWTSATTPLADADNTFRYGERKGESCISIPAGYEGWVYLPSATWLKNDVTSRYLYRINWFADELVEGKDIQISNLMVVDGDVNTADGVKVNDFTYEFAKQDKFYSVTALDIKDVTMSIDGIYSADSKDGKNALGYNSDDTALYPELSTDSFSRKYGIIKSLYSANVAGSDLLESLAAAKRPKDNTEWSFFNVTEAGVEGRNLYNVSFKAPKPFESTTNIYDKETLNTNANCNKTYGAQYIDLFDVEDTTQTPTAYVGGPYKFIGYNTNTGANNFAAIRPENFFIDTNDDNVADTHISVEGKSVLFYIKHTYINGIAEEDKQPMNATFMLKNYFTRNGYKYYSYDITNKFWEEKEIIKPENRGGLNATAVGAIELDTDFEGWVMIPASSFWLNTSSAATSWDDFRFTAECFGGIYGEVTLGDITVVDFESPFEVANGSKFTSSNENVLVDVFPFETISETISPKKEIVRLKGVNSSITGLTVKGNTTAKVATFTTDKTFLPKVENNVVTYGDATSVAIPRIDYYDDATADTKTDVTNYNAIMFRVKNNFDVDTAYFIGENTTFLKAGSPYYLLSDANNVWQDKYTNDSTYRIMINNAYCSGATLSIPANFEGWVSIPRATYRGNSPPATMYRISFFPTQQLSGSIEISNISFSANVKPKYYLENNIAKGMNAKIDDLPLYSAGSEKTVRIEGGVLTSDYDGLYTRLEVSGSIAAGEALMFYAKNTADDNISFNTSIGDNTTVMGYTLSGRVWASLSQGDKIVIPKGFDGWVKIAVTKDTDFDYIKIMFRSLKNGLALSDFMVLNQSADLISMRRGTRFATGLFYTRGDFNLDAVVDVCDLVYADTEVIKEDDITRLDGDESQVVAIRKHILEN